MKEGHPEMSELRELDTRSLREKKKSYDKCNNGFKVTYKQNEEIEDMKQK